jgi:hypothetical protein
MKIDPQRDAPTPSNFRAEVNDKSKPTVVEITINQKNPDITELNPFSTNEPADNSEVPLAFSTIYFDA